MSTTRGIYTTLFAAIRMARGFTLDALPNRDLSVAEQGAYSAYISREWNQTWESLPLRQRREVREASKPLSQVGMYAYGARRIP